MLSNINNIPNISLCTPAPARGGQLKCYKQPCRDMVCFGANVSVNPKFIKALDKKDYLSSIVIESVSPITIKRKSSNSPAKAYLAKIKGTYGGSNSEAKWGAKANALAVFSEDGKLLGDIKNLNPECSSQFGKYLHVRDLNASYSDEYKGIGSALIEAARDVSNKLGLGGQLKVRALNIFDESRGTPVPFYQKLGFVSPKDIGMPKDLLLKECELREKQKIVTEMYLLTPENKKLLSQTDTKKRVN